jgi:triacylglycerol lipase
MIGTWLRGILAVQLLLLAFGVRSFLQRGVDPATALLAAALIFLIANAAPPLLALAIAHSRRGPAARSTRRLGAVRAALAEYVAYLALFALIQPFERLWLGPDAQGRLPPGRVPVLLVHGYLCNRGLWWWMRGALRRSGLAVATVNLEPPLAGLDRAAEALGARIDALLAETGAEEVALVGHSCGGLVARAYLRRRGGSRVSRLVTIASPHRGSIVARIGIGRNAREMERGSAWLDNLAAGEEMPVPVLSIWSPSDEFVAPADSASLAGAREIVLPGIGHLAMVFSRRVLAILLTELRTESPPRNESRAGAG